MNNPRRTEIRAHGVRILLSRHPEIRRLKRNAFPVVHGNKLWNSSWLLMEYCDRKGIPKGAKVMEAGSGWGLAGIYCAKKFDAKVIAVDFDTHVFPYLQLHAEVNGVKIAPEKREFDRITKKDLNKIDILIGADICFWDKMIDSLRRLIKRALKAGVNRVLIADPGRTTFEHLGHHFVEKGQGRIFDVTTQRPKRIRGRILEIFSVGNLSH